ncbi:hypothetical protein B0T17DRAFT_456954, partial [Bombardia bombarda]
KALAIRFGIRNRNPTLDEFHLLELACQDTSSRMPILMLHMSIKQDTADWAKRLTRRYLASEGKWQKRVLRMTTSLGHTEADIKHWLRILSAPTPDLSLDRFTLSDRWKPLFLLMMLVGRDKFLENGDSFVALVNYLKSNFIQRPDLGTQDITTLLTKLVEQCLRTFPSAMVTVAQLAASYIESIVVGCKRSEMQRNIVFNHAMQLFGKPAAVRSLQNAKYNWEAQQVLLELAAKLQPRLLIEKPSFQSVRGVMLALPKTTEERKNAKRAAITWPPYRQAWDGLDEQRRPEDGVSRSIKVANLMHEAGYSDSVLDEIMTVLGGSRPGLPPTVQTRSFPPPAEMALSRPGHMLWAARVKATRTVREAWKAFDSPPEENMKPDAEVYGELIKKLLAKTVGGPNAPYISPGDTSDVFPVYDGNLTPFEIARQTPPSVVEVYHEMLQQGIKPSVECLAALLRRCRSEEDGAAYLKNSSFGPCNSSLLLKDHTFTPAAISELNSIPGKVFNAWIQLLCNTHTRQNESLLDAPDLVNGLSPIERAIRLTSLYQARDEELDRTDKRPWYIIMEALAGRKVIYNHRSLLPSHLYTFRHFFSIFNREVEAKGVDGRLFKLLCQASLKTLRMTFWDYSKSAPLVSGAGKIRRWRATRWYLQMGYTAAVQAFETVIMPYQVTCEQDNSVPRLKHDLPPHYLLLYMNLVGCFNDAERMMRLMDWIFDSW